MDHDEVSPTPAEEPTSPRDDEVASSEHSGSRWEPGATSEAHATHEHAVPGDDVASTASWDRTAAADRPRRRGRRVAAGIGAAVLLAGGGFGVGYAVGDSGPDGGPGPAAGHHRDHDGAVGGSQGQAGQAGENTSATPSAILGGLFT